MEVLQNLPFLLFLAYLEATESYRRHYCFDLLHLRVFLVCLITLYRKKILLIFIHDYRELHFFEKCMYMGYIFLIKILRIKVWFVFYFIQISSKDLKNNYKIVYNVSNLNTMESSGRRAQKKRQSLWNTFYYSYATFRLGPMADYKITVSCDTHHFQP